MLLLLLSLSWWWGAPPALAHPQDVDSCHPEQLVDARTEATLQLFNHKQNFVEAKGEMAVHVPVTWPYAKDLLLSESSDEHQHAMRCLLRGDQDGAQYRYLRTNEWRMHGPEVTAALSSVTVRCQVLSWLNHRGRFNVGPWTADVGADRWQLSLTPPTALESAHWDHVQIDPGGLNVSEVSPMPPVAGDGSLVWNGIGPSGGLRPTVTVEMVPSWQRAWAASTDTDPWRVVNAAGQTVSWVGTSAAVMLAALWARRRQADTADTVVERGSFRALMQWALLSAVIGLVLMLLFNLFLDGAKAPTDLWSGRQHWQALLGILIGWALVVLARPRWSLLLAATLVAAAGALVAVRPSLFGLPAPHTSAGSLHALGIAALAVMTAAAVWLGLAGLLLWAWRLARAGRLIRSSRLPWAGTVLAVVTFLLLALSVWADELSWQRVSWLIDRSSPAYHSLHVLFLSQQTVAFAAGIPTWCYSRTWVLTGLAILALLRARELGRRAPSVSPTGFDFLLLAVFFAIVAAWREGSYAGSQLLGFLWLALDVAALYGLLALGRRRAVLSQHFEGRGAPALSEVVIDRADHQDLIERARRYRELVVELRALEQGHGEGAHSRHELEEELRRLHWWESRAGNARATPRSLPNQVTVLDVALSWGPHARWWGNAVRAAVVAAVVGLPWSIIMIWLDYSSPQAWMFTEQDPFGYADLLGKFLTSELSWAGSGLMLGAMWRQLPGRRGPARALGLWVAYTVLVALDIAINTLADQDLGDAPKAIGLMLPVLTVTGLAMDADTFRTERRLWPNRFGLLLSIYQMRGLSAQIAWVLVQVGALVAIWQHFGGFDTRTMKPH
ncbi:hypothetical protein GCM10010430_02490 [Kitasatospora cystarginea]|uniref:Uncharacterized protein n=1 Tax=Kitasatospora cystarginea TaxID=58350 RepID=A0ABN3DBR4_9ACTN